MNRFVWSLAVFCGLPLLAAAGREADPPHLELDLAGADYRKIFDRIQIDEGSLAPVMELGKRNLDWLVFINQSRETSKKLSFSSKENQIAFPIDSPRESNPTIIMASYHELKGSLPKEMSEVLFGNSAFTTDPPIPEKEYLQWGVAVDRIYSYAARWILQEPYLGNYANRKKDDIRGYYYLSREPDLKGKLEKWSSNSDDQKIKYRIWLVGICLNDTTFWTNDCTRELDSLISGSGNVYPYYRKYESAARRKYGSYFTIPFTRDDVVWTPANPTVFSIPFLRPESSEVQDFLVGNIEDEWRWNSPGLAWNLRLNFKSGGVEMPHLVFVPGAIPHVNGLTGNEITMDANAPLTEYLVQWAIRHEFGHVLGFPDCYVEYYDDHRRVMVSYQIDITNLMCSRKGHFQEAHYNELKQAYFKNL